MNAEQTGRAEWVRAAVEQYAGPLARYAAQLLGDEERARDVVQDTFVRLCGEDPRRLRERLAPWLFAVCRNRALDVARKEGRMRPLTDEEMASRPSPELSPAAAAERREATDAALHALATLPRNQQEVVRLKFQNGLSYQEISQVTNLTVSNVGFLIHTAIKSLRGQLRLHHQLVPSPAKRTP